MADPCASTPGTADDASKPVTRCGVGVATAGSSSTDSNTSRVVSLRSREQVSRTKRQLLSFLIAAKEAGKSVAGYGAPGKGNTLLNYCGIRTDFLDYTVDRNPYKHGKFTPGTHIPIFAPEKIDETRPDYVLILPWNFKDEIVKQMSHIRAWGGRFVVPIPTVQVIE